MLKRLFGNSAPSTADTAHHVRRIGGGGSSTSDVGLSRREVPTVSAQIQRQTFVDSESGVVAVTPTPPPLSQLQPITSVEDIGNWRSIVPGLVSESDKEKCVVLDREYSSVLILATPEFYASGAHNALVSKTRSKTLSIEAERTTNTDIINQVISLAENKQRGAINHVVKDDDRNLALYEDLTKGAFNIGASDVHYEIENFGKSKVRLRLYGRMRDWKEFDSKVLLDAVAAGFNGKTKNGTASGPSWSKDRSLSTMTEHVINGTNVNGRFSTYPVITGLDVVVRLLESDPRTATVPTLQKLGYAESQITDQLMTALQKNSGLLAVAGGTGSGKSTALKTLMHNLPHKDTLKRFSVEDPVEYIMPGVRQISIQRGADDDENEVKKKFLSALRMLVRMDPDAAMIGEIRDKESGEIASELVQTGHRVLTTVHGDGAIDVISRLTGRLINIPSEVMSTRKFLSAVMYQKLMPVLCPECKVSARSVMHAKDLTVIQRRFSLDTNTMYCAKDTGCEHCRIDGIESGGTKGLTVAAEIIIPNTELLGFIRDHDWVGAELSWRKTRRSGFGDADMTGKTAFEHALYKASIGIIDPRDIERDFETFHAYEIFEGVTQ